MRPLAACLLAGPATTRQGALWRWTGGKRAMEVHARSRAGSATESCNTLKYYNLSSGKIRALWGNGQKCIGAYAVK